MTMEIKELSDSSSVLAFPSQRAWAGELRLRETRGILGAGAERELQKEFGRYELCPELQRELQLEGLDLPANGELSFLSPASWDVDALPEQLWTAATLTAYLETEHLHVTAIHVPRWAVPVLRSLAEKRNFSLLELLDLSDLTVAHECRNFILSAKKGNP